MHRHTFNVVYVCTRKHYRNTGHSNISDIKLAYFLNLNPNEKANPNYAWY